jgi:hypothetical protein
MTLVLAPESLHVMPGLVPGIHVFLCAPARVDGRVKPGHDGEVVPEDNPEVL